MRSFVKINMKLLKCGNEAYLTTKEISPAEAQTLDYISGFQLIDKEMRFFILEGRGNSMTMFYRENERMRPNDRYFKMLYNPEIRYSRRMYAGFNCSMKLIKLRETISSIITQPDIFTKVSPEIFQVMNSLAEIRKHDRALLIKEFDLLPKEGLLLNLERKYGDELTHEDISGIQPKRKKRRRNAQVSKSMHSSSIPLGTQTTFTQGQKSSLISQSTHYEKPQDSDSDDLDQQIVVPKRNPDTDARNPEFSRALKLRISS